MIGPSAKEMRTGVYLDGKCGVCRLLGAYGGVLH